MIENLRIIISVLGTIVGLIITNLTFLSKMIKNKKSKKKLDSLNAILQEMINLIEEAEIFLNYTGEEKKTYVMSRLATYAYKNKINIEENLLTEKLEELIELTKKVNFKNKSITSLKEYL